METDFIKELTCEFKKDFGKNIIFDEFILKPYKELKEIFNSIKNKQRNFYKNSNIAKIEGLKEIYKSIYDVYTEVTKIQIDNTKINVLIAKNFRVTVCPYCNANYINNRGKTNSGAQLDHFYSRSKYPIFSVCLYNFIPSCAACNSAKSTAPIDVSPHDESFDFENSLRFSYVPESYDFVNSSGNLKIDIRVIDNNKDSSINTNIANLKIKEAYEIHGDYVLELIKKSIIYNETQIQEYLDLYPDLFTTKEELLRTIFGNYIEEKDLYKRPLSKLTKNILEELGIDLH